MADYFGNRYWTAKYFPAGYWGVDEPAPEGAMFASLSGSGSVVADLGYVPTVEIDYFDTHDGKPKKPTEEIQQERYRAQQQGIRDAIAKFSTPPKKEPGAVETVESSKPLPAVFTRLLEVPFAIEQQQNEDDEIAIMLAMGDL